MNSVMKLRIPYTAENFVTEENVPLEGGLRCMGLVGWLFGWLVACLHACLVVCLIECLVG